MKDNNCEVTVFPAQTSAKEILDFNAQTDRDSTINSIKDDNKFESNSVKMLYSLPINSYTLVNDKENKIYLVKLISSKKNTFNETDENYLNFVNNQNTNTRKSILQSYDQLLNSKYEVQLNQKTIDRVKNYFK